MYSCAGYTDRAPGCRIFARCPKLKALVSAAFTQRRRSLFKIRHRADRRASVREFAQ
jgi:hypothetical protein